MSNLVILKCRNCDSISISSYRVFVYDHKNNLIIDDYTNNIGDIEIRFPCYDVYKIIILDLKRCKRNCIIVLINEETHDKIYFFSDIKINTSHPIKLILTDKYYKGLPIEKGDLVLCKNT